MSDIYTGECKGGPLDGQMLAHWEKRKKFFSPVTPFPLGDEIIGVEIGEYRLNDYGQWHWWETDTGKALKTIQRLEP